MRKLPPIEKTYEAYSAIANSRITLFDNHATVLSSNKEKEYTVTWDKTDCAANDNATHWQGLGRIATKNNIILQTCGPEENYARYGIETSGCVTQDILGRANDLQFRNLKHRGFRKGCHCIESRDIGALDNCPNGCKYGYANKNRQLSLENSRLHDPQSPLLTGHLKTIDRLEAGAQKPFLKCGAECPAKNT